MNPHVLRSDFWLRLVLRNCWSDARESTGLLERGPASDPEIGLCGGLAL